MGACAAYITAALDNWRRCFDNGLVVEAQPQGGQRYRQGRAVCASVAVRGAATVRGETWRDAAGRTLATATIPYGRDVWTVSCDGGSYTVDPASPACASDPWVRAHNPHAPPCPLDRGDACRVRYGTSLARKRLFHWKPNEAETRVAALEAAADRVARAPCGPVAERACDEWDHGRRRGAQDVAIQLLFDQ